MTRQAIGSYTDDSNFPYQFMCTLSKACKLLIKVGSKEAKKKFDTMIEDLVRSFEEDAQLKAVMKSDAYRLGIDATALRQVDIKNDDQNVMFQTFVFWNMRLGLWHILIQLPAETEFPVGKPVKYTRNPELN